MADFIIWTHSDPAVQYWLKRISSVMWLSLTPMYLYFSYLLIKRRLDWILYTQGAMTLFFVAATLFTDTVVAGIEQRHWGVATVPGSLHYPAIIACAVIPGLWSIRIVGKCVHTASGLERTQLLFFLSGIGLTWGLVLAINIVVRQLMGFDDVPMLGSSLVIIQAFVVFIASTRYRFLKVGVQEVAMDIFSKSSDGVLLLEQNGRIFEINDTAKKMLHVSTVKAMNRFAEELIPSPYNFAEDSENQEIQFKGDSKHEAQTGLLSQCDFYQGKIWAGKLVTIRNITELKAAEQARAAQVALKKRVHQHQEMKMLALGELAGEIVHSVNNLMGGIVGYTSLLRKKLQGNSEVQPLIDGIRRTVENAVSMGEELLRFTKPGNSPKEKVDLHLAVGHSVSLAKASFREDIEFEIDLKAVHFVVMGTRADLENMLLNLFINAKDAMPNGGTVFVSTENETAGTNGVFDEQTDMLPFTVQLTVRDTGNGINPKIIDRVFEPFFTTRKKEGGTGLGLSNTFGIVKKMGGNIFVDSYPGKGATFMVSLPTRKNEEK